MDLSTLVGPELLKLGLPGVVIIGLWLALKAERERSASLTDKLMALQDKRVEDTRDTTRAIEANTAATNASTTALQGLSSLLMARAPHS